MRLGAHVSARESVHLAVDRAAALGCECLQIFVCNPRQWQTRPLTADAAGEFRRKLAASGMDPLVAHAPYLVNLAAVDREFRDRATATLCFCLRAITACGGRAVVTHVGSRMGARESVAIRRVAATVRRVLRAAPEGELWIENSAGGTLGGSLEELARILDAVDGTPRVGVCLDTAHLFASGWDLRTPAAVAALVDAVERTIGLSRVRLFHLNDSRSELGSRLDRHENIGEGHIGRAGFRALLRDPRLSGHAGVIETPGYDKQGPDLRNMNTLRALAAGPGRRPLRRRSPSPGERVPRPSRRRRPEESARRGLSAT